MRRQFPTWLAAGFVLTVAHQIQAQEFLAPPVPAVPVTAGYTLPYQRGCSLKRFCKWLCYRPLPVPAKYQCQGLQKDALPPLYLYFVGEYGPRSPELAIMTGGYAAGGVFNGPSLFPNDPTANGLARATANPLESPALAKATAAAGSRKPTQAPANSVPTRVIGRENTVPVPDVASRPIGRQNPVPVRDLPAAASGQELRTPAPMGELPREVSAHEAAHTPIYVPVRDVPPGQDLPFHGTSQELPVHQATSLLPVIPATPTSATGN